MTAQPSGMKALLQIEQAAQRLRMAYCGEAVPPLRDILAPNDADSAYAIQSLNTIHWKSQGRRIVGRKIGLTSKAVQRQLGVERPDYGVLFDDMRIEDGATLDSSLTIAPKAEAEVALIISKALESPRVSAEDVFAAARFAAAAIEIVDSRIADWKISYADTVADNGSSGFFVIGQEYKPLPGLDLYSCGMVLEVDGEVESVGAGAACLGHPLNAAAWLASTLAELGEPLQPDDIVLTGALGPMVALSPGNHVKATISGLGSVSFRFGSG